MSREKEKFMKQIMMILGLAAVAFMAGTLVSCSVRDDVAPPPVPPVNPHSTGSYVTPAK